MVASELLDHLAAGFDTSAITLTFMIYQLSICPGEQNSLRRELRDLSPRLEASSSPHLPDPKVLDALPVLHAIVMETLRLTPAIPGPQPRYTPQQGCQLGPNHEYFVPGGVRVSASAGLLHKNEEVYYHSKKFRPGRWLNIDKVKEERRKDMESRWFWAFGRSVYQSTLEFRYSPAIAVDECVWAPTWQYIVSTVFLCNRPCLAHPGNFVSAASVP